MAARLRLIAAALLGVLVVALLFVPSADAAAVPKVTGLTPNGSNVSTARLGLKWKKVSGASYQVRWAISTAKLGAAHVYATNATSATSPVLSNICVHWWAQVRAKKGGKLGPWSSAKELRFIIPAVRVPTPITTGQTDTHLAQVRWKLAPGAQAYRLDWSPAAFGNWPGRAHTYTPFLNSRATAASVAMPTVGAGDHFIGGAYGNPIFAQLDVKRCDGSISHSHYVPVYPKPASAGSAATGNALRFGSYNVELTPQAGDPDIAAEASNIHDADLNVLALQEANSGTMTALINQLAVDGQTDWEGYTVGQQAVLYRTGDWTRVSAFDVGDPVDGTAGVAADADDAKTPLPTPAVLLTPAVADPTRQNIFVVSPHLEDRKKFDSAATIPQEKQDAHDAVDALLAKIATDNPDAVPTLIAGDLKGNFGGGGQLPTAGNCDETSTPFCRGEGQPTFVRAGYLDARGAQSLVGTAYGTVNGHHGTQAPSSSGVGGRPDFILVRGFTGISRYVNLANKMYPGLVAADNSTPSDHNLIYADLFIPFVPSP